MYTRIASIPAFAQYRLWKCYTVWRKNVRRCKMHACGEALNERLFRTNPVLNECLLTVKTACDQIASLQMTRIVRTAAYTLESFLTEQRKQIALVR